MSVSLRVTIENMCLFVLWDDGAEAWMLTDESHAHEIEINGQRRDLAGFSVTFGAAGQQLPMEYSKLAGRGRYLSVLDIEPDATLRDGWVPGREELPTGMAARIALPGGTIASHALIASDDRVWFVGDSRGRPLASGSTFRRTVPDAPFVRLRKLDSVVDIAVTPDSDGVFAVTIRARDTRGEATMVKQSNEVFAVEVEAFEKAIELPLDAKFPVPHTFWPEYEPCDKSLLDAIASLRKAHRRMTDPCGGPCPEGLLDLRSDAVAVTKLGARSGGQGS